MGCLQIVFLWTIRYWYGEVLQRFCFFRCPITEEVDAFIKLAKYYNKPVFFDIDDLVIDKKYTDQISYLKTMSAEEKRVYDDGVRANKQTLLSAIMLLRQHQH